MDSGSVISKRLARPAIAALLSLLALACVPPDPDPGTTTTASTTTTSSIPGGDCDDYTPTGVTVSNTTPTAGSTILVSGNGAPGETVTITLVKVSDSSSVDPGASTTVTPGGTWSTSVNLPVSMDFGQWNVVATSGDNCSASTLITIS